MPSYFTHFPTVNYNGVILTDVTRRAKFLENLRVDPLTFLPYTVSGDDRPEDVAFYYYGDAGFVWLVYLANNIIDPYTDWVMTDSDFEQFLMKKYATDSGTTGFEVLNWTLNDAITTNIIHYENIVDPTLTLSPDTVILSDSSIEVSEWSPVRVYEYESRLNEDKRNVTIINKIYADSMEKELEALLNG